ncbi:hypothetical protein KIS1582_2908 [Cytobacillus firmus]|uniref:Uncharacterized protein n=1 Tax=Cytobacillus firmus TaxID=1399 RepID=A0A800MVR5_CYTFI|nr:hypothetical protein KIS1582_2908 [Cytobacillus firmus]
MAFITFPGWVYKPYLITGRNGLIRNFTLSSHQNSIPPIIKPLDKQAFPPSLSAAKKSKYYS